MPTFRSHYRVPFSGQVTIWLDTLLKTGMSCKLIILELEFELDSSPLKMVLCNGIEMLASSLICSVHVQTLSIPEDHDSDIKSI